MSIAIGDTVPDFTFRRADGSEARLSSFSAPAIVMIFLRHLA